MLNTRIADILTSGLNEVIKYNNTISNDDENNLRMYIAYRYAKAALHMAELENDDRAKFWASCPILLLQDLIKYKIAVQYSYGMSEVQDIIDNFVDAIHFFETNEVVKDRKIT